MKGYKGSYNGRCLNQRYEVGETYTLGREPELCLRGYHFCSSLTDISLYYSIHRYSFVLFEIEAQGKVKNDKSKSVTDKIKIIREVPRKEWREITNGEWTFNEEENSLKYHINWWKRCLAFFEINKTQSSHFPLFTPNTKWCYDKDGKIIYYEQNKYWEKTEYDELGKIKKKTNSTGIMYEYKYEDHKPHEPIVTRTISGNGKDEVVQEIKGNKVVLPK